jgi:hypothetical protein
VLPISLELRGGVSNAHDDHIFEKTLIIELSPIPQAYTLKEQEQRLVGSPYTILFLLIGHCAFFKFLKEVAF